MSSFIVLFSEIPNSPFRIVCIRVQWNHSDLSGRAGWAVTREWGGCERNGYWVDLGGAKYADQTVTGWLHGPYEANCGDEHAR